MSRHIRALVFITFILTAAFVFAQHGEHGGGSGPVGLGRSGDDQAARKLREAILIQGTEEQRTQYQRYSAFAARIQERADALAGTEGMSLAPAQAKTDADQIRQALAGMQQAYADFEASLDEPQSKAVGKQLQKMRGLSAALTTRLRDLDQELAREAPEGKRVSRCGKRLLDAIGDWRSEQQKVADKLGLAG